MTELETIQILRDMDEDEARKKLLQHQIEDATVRLRQLEKLRLDLEGEHQRLSEAMHEIEEENDRLSNEFVEPDLTDRCQGSFFEQLRIVEGIEEHLTEQVTGFKTCNSRLQGEINATEARIRRYHAQLEDARKSFQNTDAEFRRANGDLIQKRAKLRQLDEELDIVTKACQDIKDAVKAKADEMKGFTEKDAATLLAQKKALEVELKARREEKKTLEHRERDLNIRQMATKKLREKNSALNQSANAWMSQRLSLVAKVKRAKEELELLTSRERGASKSDAKASELQRNMDLNDEDAKHALASEIEELNNEKSVFLENTLKTEMRVKEELEKKLRDFEGTSVEILEFQKTTMELLAVQKSNAAKEQRIAVLKKELADLRGCLGK